MRYPTLAEALRGTRGVYSTDDRGYTSLGFRGLSLPGSYGKRVLVTLDGMPTNDDWSWASFNGFDLRTDLEDIDRIEVVRGPGSVVYGTSAFTGVINLVSRNAEVPSGVETSASAVSDGVLRGRIRLTHHFGPHAGAVHEVAITPDGKRLAAAVPGGTVVVWDTMTGREAITLRIDQTTIRGVAFTPDGLALTQPEAQLLPVLSNMSVPSWADFSRRLPPGYDPQARRGTVPRRGAVLGSLPPSWLAAAASGLAWLKAWRARRAFSKPLKARGKCGSTLE